MSDKKVYTEKELQEFKEMTLVVLQDALASAVTGMVGVMDLLNMVPILLSIIHAIFHEGGEHTRKCEDESGHVLTLQTLKELHDCVIQDRSEQNDVIDWIDNPQKAAILENMNQAKVESLKRESQEVQSGHLF